MSGRAARAGAAARPAAVLLWATAGPGVGGALVLLALLPHADGLRGGGLRLAAALLVLGTLGCGLAVIPTHLLSLVSGWSLGVPVGLGRVWKPPAAKATAGGAAAKEGEAGGCGPRMQPDAGSGFSRRATPSGF